MVKDEDGVMGQKEKNGCSGEKTAPVLSPGRKEGGVGMFRPRGTLQGKPEQKCLKRPKVTCRERKIKSVCTRKG